MKIQETDYLKSSCENNDKVLIKFICIGIFLCQILSGDSMLNKNSSDASDYAHKSNDLQDSLALVDLYNSTNGANWTNNTNWLTNNSLDTWHGVTVSGERVTKLELDSNNLSGTIPSSIGDLTALKELYLFSNQLSGTIPSEIGSLINLTTLGLYNNSLSGSIPPEIGGLINLQQLYLFSNQLSGTIPTEIGTLINLQELYLYSNQLSGSIPTEIGSLANLTRLLAPYNQLNGPIPVEIFSLTNLTDLNLSYNQLSGPIPGGLSSLINLSIFYLNSNLITGSIPAEIGSLSSLTKLFLSNNSMSGSIPSELGSLTNLDELGLDHNQLIGAVPSEFDALTKLTYLELSSNQLEDIPDLSAILTLNNLTIGNNKFTFENIEPNITISNFTYSPQDSIGAKKDTALIEGKNLLISVAVGGTANQYQWMKDGVDLGGENNDTLLISNAQFSDSGSYTCRITNTIASALTLYSRPINVSIYTAFDLDSLALVDLYNSTAGANWTNNTNWLTSSSLGTWYGVTVSGGRVTELSLHNNNLSDTIPSSIGNLTNLTTLSLDSNQLSGSIPPEIGSLYNLTYLSFHTNQLTGSITAEIGSLNNLTRLSLTFNQLSGSIPAEIGFLNNLTHLALSYNSLSGSIPTEICSLTNLISLGLNANLLSNTIPPEFGSLTNLRYLYLHSNSLSGSIPTEICSLANLIYLYLYSNQFEDLPDLSSIPTLDTLYMYDNKFTFEDIEPNINVSTFTYSPQDSIGTEKDIIIEKGENLIISVSVGGTANQYQWMKDGIDIGGETNDTLVITNAELSDSGAYICRITNTIATALSLYGRPINVSIYPLLKIDSLALVDLYNSTNGPNWSDKTNWLTNSSLDTWYGVTVSGGRVIRLDLDSNNLSGTIPASIGNLINLTNLALDYNQLIGTIPQEICSLTNLYTLGLFSNNLSGTIPSEIGLLTKLVYLNLCDNQLSGSIPPEIGTLNNLVQLYLNTNQLSGSIPPEIGELTNLTNITLQENQLTGTIPTEIGSLTKLKTMNFSSNQLSGAIPSEIGALTDLTSLCLSSNQLNSTIPAEIGSLSKLTYLNLWVNQLIGSVPLEIGTLNNLNMLYLANNQLEDLPDLSSISTLNELFIQNNKFTFEDIEPNIMVDTFIYSPQDSIGTEKDTSISSDENLIFSVSVGGTANQYQWMKNGVDIGGENNDTLNIFNAELSDSGTYACKITNTIATALTLYSRAVNVSVYLTGNVTSFQAACAGEDSIALSWSVDQLPSGADSMKVLYSGDNYPPDHDSGIFVKTYPVSTVKDTVIIPGLSEDSTYYFAAFVRFGGNVWSLASEEARDSVIIPDFKAPDTVTELIATPVSNTEINLTWKKSIAPDAYSIRIIYSTDSINTMNDTTGNTWVMVGDTVESYSAKGLIPNTVYNFAVFVRDEVPNWNIGTFTTATTMKKITGDFNGDKIVGFGDLSYVSNYWYMSTKGITHPDSIQELAPATGDPPYLTITPDSLFNYKDLKVFVMMCYWSKDNQDPITLNTQAYPCQDTATAKQQIHLDGDDDAATVNIGFMVRDISQLVSCRYRIYYNEKVLSFNAFNKGDKLVENSGEIFSIASKEEGSYTIGLTRLSAYTRSVSGSGNIGTVSFDRIKAPHTKIVVHYDLVNLHHKIIESGAREIYIPEAENDEQVTDVNFLTVVPNPSIPSNRSIQLELVNNPAALQWIQIDQAGFAVQFGISTETATTPIQTSLNIFDQTGNLIQSVPKTDILLPDNHPSNQPFTVYWNGCNKNGRKVGPGMYRLVLYYKTDNKKGKLTGNIGVKTEQ